VSADIAMDRKIRLTGRLSKRNPIQISCAIQIKHSTLIARNVKSNVAMVGPWSKPFYTDRPNLYLKVGTTRTRRRLFFCGLPSVTLLDAT
jgi:hypothetical protein